MKKVKLNLFLLLATIALFTTSCYREDLSADIDTYEDYDDYGSNEGDYDDYDDHDHSGGDLAVLSLYQINGETIQLIKDYNVDSKYTSFQNDKVKHQDMWEYFKKLIPAKNRNYITEFIVFHGEDELLGYVEPINENDLSKWRMGLAIEQAGNIDEVDIKTDFAYTSIHEYAHVLTLNSTQVDVNRDENACPTYHTGEGCSTANSYINAIYELGWKDIYDEFENLGGDGYALYDRYPNRFVTEYAATNPGEDVAEVFTVFVTMDEMPTSNTIADKKVRLMYDFPELVELREEIRKDPFARAIVPGSWVKSRKRHVCVKHFAKAN